MTLLLTQLSQKNPTLKRLKKATLNTILRITYFIIFYLDHHMLGTTSKLAIIQNILTSLKIPDRYNKFKINQS